MDANTVFKRNSGANYTAIKQNHKLDRAFLAIDGQRSIKAIASTNNYEIDDLISIVDQIEKMGLIVPVDNAKIKADDEQHHGKRTLIYRGVRVEEEDL